MTRALVVATIAAALVAIGCGGASHTSDPSQAPALAYSCMPGGVAPPAKLISHPTGGVSGHWIVLLNDQTAPVHTTAVALAQRYGGVVLKEWDQLGMFYIDMDEAAAAALSEDPAVCLVEQDQIVHV